MLYFSDHVLVSSGSIPPLPPTPPVASVPPQAALDGPQVLEFLRTENERQRNFFTDLFTKTTGILGVLIAIASAGAVFFGINTVSGAKQSAETAAQAAAQTAVLERLKELRPQIDGEVTAGVQSEFATSKIDEVVQEAAREATKTTANKIIRGEVHDQVASAVASEQGTIDRTLSTATENAVRSVQGSIQQHADQAVTKIVADQVDPQLRRLRAYSDLTSAITLAQAGDGKGYDRLRVLASDNSNPEIQHAANATINSIITQMSAPRPPVICNEGPPPAYPVQLRLKSVSTYEAQLSSNSADERMEAALCLRQPGDLVSAGQDKQSIRGSMDFLFHTMSEDPELNIRKAAFLSFSNIAAWFGTYNHVAVEVHMFDNAANAKWWKENRANFVSTPAGKP